MSLIISKVPRSLERKTRLFGFELGDLLLIFLYLTLANLIFGATQFRYYFVWLGTFILAAALYFLKRGKPDYFLLHWGEYQRAPGVLSAASPDIEFQPHSPS